MKPVSVAAAPHSLVDAPKGTDRYFSDGCLCLFGHRWLMTSALHPKATKQEHPGKSESCPPPDTRDVVISKSSCAVSGES
jgi:hypothetical protein